jgi:diguanylate cyclase (GGDEF)-like protein
LKNGIQAKTANPYMPIDSSTGTTRPTATRALLGLHLVVLSIGVLQFAFVPASVERPLLAACALAGSTIALLLVRLVPGLQQRPSRQHSIEIAAMVGTITLLAFATGGARSSLTVLNVVPLTAIAAAFGRWWLVLLLAAVLAAFGFLVGALTPNMDVKSSEFGVLLLSTLAPGAAIGLIVAALTEKMQVAVKRIGALASTDALTGLLNLRSFEQVLQQEHRKAERFGRTYSLIMIDVDNLAQVNETLGHEAGSLILNTVAAAITRSIRNSDVAARLGGDEFVVLCVETDPDVATAVAQRIRNNVYAGTVSVANRLIRANVSVGVANFPSDHLYSKELMILAEQRMQQDRELRIAPKGTR